MRSFILAAGLALTGLGAAPLLAQQLTDLPGKADTAAVTKGSYKVEPNHTQVGFAVSHMGLSPFSGVFSQASGTLTLDPANPAASSLNVSVPINSVQTTSSKLDEELKSADWFDAAQFPTATFKSSKIVRSGKNGATVTGMLTLHGVTKPVTLHAQFFGAGPNPMSKTLTVGFVANGTIKRSDFGVSKYVPMVSDEVQLTISAAFEKQG